MYITLASQFLSMIDNELPKVSEFLKQDGMEVRAILMIYN